MGRPHEERHTSQWRTNVAPDVVWEYILDADAQVRHDSRIEAILLESGAWGAVGSVMAMTGIDAEGNGTINFSPDDMQIVDTTKGSEARIALVEVSWNGGLKQTTHEFLFTVRNMRHRPTAGAA